MTLIFCVVWLALFILGLWLMWHFIFAPWKADIDAHRKELDEWERQHGCGREQTPESRADISPALRRHATKEKKKPREPWDWK